MIYTPNNICCVTNKLWFTQCLHESCCHRCCRCHPHCHHGHCHCRRHYRHHHRYCLHHHHHCHGGHHHHRRCCLRCCCHCCHRPPHHHIQINVYFHASVGLVYLIENIHFTLAWARSCCTFNTNDCLVQLPPNIFGFLLRFMFTTFLDMALLVKNDSKMTKIQRPPEKKWCKRIFLFL